MRPLACLATAFGLAACDQVFSLDRPLPIDAAIDAPPVPVTGSLVRTYVHNTVSGIPTLSSITPESPTVRIDGEEVELDWDANLGTFSFTGTAGGQWSVRSGGTEFVSSAAELELVDLIYGRPDQVALAPLTSLGYQVQSAITPYINIDTTGVWSASQPVATSSTTFTLDWTTANFQGRPGLINGARGDRLFFAWFQLQSTGSNAYVAVTHAKETAHEQDNGTTSTVSTALEPLSLTSCARVDAPFPDVLERVMTAYPGGTSAGAAWLLAGVPRPELGVTAFAPIATANSAVTPVAVGVDAMYANPFTGLDPILILTATTNRMVGARSVANSISYYTTPTPCGSDGSFAGDPPMPYRARLALVGLADGVTVGLAPDEHVPLTWELQGTAAADAYTVVLQEVLPGGALREVRRYLTAEPALVIANDDLGTGSYQLEIRARTGVTGAAVGDHSHQTYPFTQGVYRVAFAVSRDA